jgi:hypothetical protein
MARTRHIGVLLVVATLLLWGSAAAATASLSTGGGAVDTSSTAQVQQQEENASVTFEDQTVENGTVTVANVTVPEGGYVTIHNDSLQDGDAIGSVIGVSEYLEPGTHEDVSVTLYEDVPGADFENATEPNGTETLIAMPHMETSEEMADNETTTTTEDGVGDNQTTTEANETTTEDGLNDTETTTEDGLNETETTTEDGLNDTETTTEEAANDELSVNAQQQNQTNQTYDFVTTNGAEDGPYTENGAAVTDSAEVDFGQADEPDDDEGAAGDGDGAAGDDEEANATEGNFTVSNLSAPALAGPNETVTVNATLSNTGDEERSEDVAFRLAGDDADVVVYQSVTIEGDENQTVTFEVNASDVGEGEYIHGVTTQNSSAFANIEVTNESQVVFGDQEGDGENVTVESVFVPEGGYVAIHNDSLLDGDAIGSVVGVSEYLEPGVHENVSVTLYEDVEGADFADDAAAEDNATLIAMPHMETTDDETYDFVTSEGEDDGPYVVDGEIVVDVGNLTIAVEESPSGGSQDPNEN